MGELKGIKKGGVTYSNTVYFRCRRIWILADVRRSLYISAALSRKVECVEMQWSHVVRAGLLVYFDRNTVFQRGYDSYSNKTAAARRLHSHRTPAAQSDKLGRWSLEILSKLKIPQAVGKTAQRMHVSPHSLISCTWFDSTIIIRMPIFASIWLTYLRRAMKPYRCAPSLNGCKDFKLMGISLTGIMLQVTSFRELS